MYCVTWRLCGRGNPLHVWVTPDYEAVCGHMVLGEWLGEHARLEADEKGLFCLENSKIVITIQKEGVWRGS